MSEAPALEAWYQQYAAQGFTVMTMIGENNYGQTPSQADLMSWANQFGITHPVVADPNFDQTAQYLFADPNFNGSFGLPSMQLLGPLRVVYKSNTFVDNSDIQQVLP